jgi:hypothetical protein
MDNVSEVGDGEGAAGFRSGLALAHAGLSLQSDRKLDVQR